MTTRYVGYIQALDLVRQILIDDSSTVLAAESIFVNPDVDEYVARDVNDFPSAAIRLLGAPEFIRNGSALGYQEVSVAFAVDVVRRVGEDSASVYENDLLDVAYQVEAALQWSKMPEGVLTEIYCGQPTPALYPGLNLLTSDHYEQQNAGTTLWQETTRLIDEYGDGVDAFRVAFIWKEQRGY